MFPPQSLHYTLSFAILDAMAFRDSGISNYFESFFLLFQEKKDHGHGKDIGIF